MTTAYPSGLDAFTNPTGVSNLNDAPVLHSAAHANLNDAVEALEAELGLLPKGGSASVRARLDALDTTVAAKALATRTISAGTGLTGGGDLTANRTLTVDLEYLQDQVAAMLTAGTNVTLSYNDTTGALTINATGGGGAAFPATYSGGPAGATVYPPDCNAGGTGRHIGNQPAGNRLVWFPMDLGACTITGFACNVTGAGDGSAVIKVGLWDDYGGVRPKTLQSTLGSAVATSTGTKTVSGLSVAWPGGRLWLGAVEQGHSATCAQITHDPAFGAVASTQTLNPGYSAIGQDGVSGALPSTAAGENTLTDMRPRIWLVIQ